MKPNKQLVDFLEMTSVVKFCYQYCNICHSTDHSLTNCEKKGCRLCLSKNHPFWKCTQRCKCGKRPHHLEKSCPNRKVHSKEGDEPREFATPALGEKFGVQNKSQTTGQTQASHQATVAQKSNQGTANNKKDGLTFNLFASPSNLSVNTLIDLRMLQE